MAYERVNWENLPSTKTPINQTNLNKMENGIAGIDKTVGLKGYLDNNTDLNNVTETGIYSTKSATLTNAPVSNYNWAFLIVLNQNNVIQQYFIKPITDICYMRERSGWPVAWSKWQIPNEVSTINFIGWNSTYPCHSDGNYVYINVPRGKLKEGNISMNNTGLHFWNWSGQTIDVTFSGLVSYQFTTTELILRFPGSELASFDPVMWCFTKATIITST